MSAGGIIIDMSGRPSPATYPVFHLFVLVQCAVNQCIVILFLAKNAKRKTRKKRKEESMRTLATFAFNILRPLRGT